MQKAAAIPKDRGRFISEVFPNMRFVAIATLSMMREWMLNAVARFLCVTIWLSKVCEMGMIRLNEIRRMMIEVITDLQRML